MGAATRPRAGLKGGLVLELRLERARTTKDIDIRLAGSIADILPRLQAPGRLDLYDFMTFEVLPERSPASVPAPA